MEIHRAATSTWRRSHHQTNPPYFPIADFGPLESEPIERIERAILLIRGQKVMFDRDLAELYEVETKMLNQAVKMHYRRFPPDSMFQLTYKEVTNLKSQFVTSSSGWGGRRKLPCVFTEQGVSMLSGVRNSDRAVDVNITIMRAFVKLRQLLASHVDLARKLEELESRYDEQFRIVFDAIRQLMTPPDPPRRRIGYNVADE